MFEHHAGHLWFALSAVVDALVVCGFVLWAARVRPRPPLLAAGVALVLALLAVKGVLMIRSGLEPHFGVMHVVWLDLVVVVPLAAALLGLLTWRTAGWAVRGLVVVGLLAAPVGAYASFVEPSRLVVEEARTEPLPDERAGDDPFRVAVLADIQFERIGDHEREAIDLLMEQRPDLILLSGDYHQGAQERYEALLPQLRELFGRLRAPGGVFAVQGDSESIEETREIFAGTGIRTLVNEVATTRVGDREVVIGGVELRHWKPLARRFTRGFETRPGTDDVRILLAHRPDTVLQLAPESRVDLVVSGHTHGGQVQLPLIGPISTASRISRDVAAGGLHETDEGNAVYVSRGIGVERGQAPKLRLGAPPEISVLEVR